MPDLPISSFIIWYLFLAGIGSGSFVIAVMFEIFGQLKYKKYAMDFIPYAQTGFLIAPVCMIFAGLFLLVDLGHPERVWSILLFPCTSIASAGAWIVTVFTVIVCTVAIVLFVARTHPGRATLFLELIGSLFAVLVMAYTGVLLMGLGSVDFWGTVFVPLLFIASSLSTGLSSIVGIGFFLNSGRGRGEDEVLWRIVPFASIIEALILVSFLIYSALFSTETASMSAEMLFLGSYAPLFWLGVVGFGLVFPIASHLIANKIPLEVIVPISSIAVLIGGICLRYGIIGSGIHSPLL